MRIISRRLRLPRPGRHPAREAAAASSSLLLGLVLVSFFLINNFVPAASAVQTTEILPDTTVITEILTVTGQRTETVYTPPESEPPEYVPVSVDPLRISSGIGSPYAILVDMATMHTVAERSPDEKMYPASMTKVMTLILVCELNPDFSGEFCVTEEIVNEVAAGSGSNVGLAAGETVSVKDLVYSMMLPSACDSAKCLACLISGTEAEFAKLMNRKAEQIGMTGTHFSNASGMHSADNYSTARDIAALMSCAYENETARKVMSTESYTMSATEKHAARRIRNTVFRLDDTYTGERTMGKMTLICGKTGTANAAGRCLVSVAAAEDGRLYLLVTGGATSTRLLVDDTYYIYSSLCG